jgi:PAS domain S-box-containing protein
MKVQDSGVIKMPLRVLVVEDSEDDTYLLERELQRGEFQPSIERVDTHAAMDSALRRHPWDLVISDHSMPGFGSLEALKLLREKQPDVPFIVVSGTIGEKKAVSLMKAGVNDCLNKDELKRLVPSIKRELCEADKRRARRRTEEEQAALGFLGAIVESSEDAIIGTTLDGVILSWNAGAEAMYGYDASEVKGLSISVLIPPYRPEELPENFARIKRGERIARTETLRLRKDGATMDVSVTLSPIKDATGKVIGISAIERDIRARKQEEEERLKLIDELTVALGNVRALKGLLPICSSCKKIRDDRGYWQKVESYISQHTGAEFTHGICPDCMRRLYPEYSLKKPVANGGGPADE